MSEPDRVTLTWVTDHLFDGGKVGRPSVRIDGDGAAGPSPVSTLLIALASCASTDMVDILAKRRTPVSAMDVEVVAKRVDTVPRHLEHVTLNFKIAGDGIERVHAERAAELAIAKYCSVRSSLRPDVPVEWTIALESDKA